MDFAVRLSTSAPSSASFRCHDFFFFFFLLKQLIQRDDSFFFFFFVETIEMYEFIIKRVEAIFFIWTIGGILWRDVYRGYFFFFFVIFNRINTETIWKIIWNFWKLIKKIVYLKRCLKFFKVSKSFEKIFLTYNAIWSFWKGMDLHKYF